MGLYCRISKITDVDEIITSLRIADKREIIDSLGLDIKTSLLLSMSLSDAPLSIVAEDTDEVLGLLGVRTVDTQPVKAGAIWMMASEKIERYKIPFLKASREWVNFFNKEYPLLFNYVDDRNDLHKKWLKWCGFTFLNKVPRGVKELPFIEFVRLNINV